MKLKIKENFKQIGLTVFAFLLIGIGYVNYSKQDFTKFGKSISEEEQNIGDVELVNSSNTDEEELEVEENESLKEEIKEDYFTESKIEREKMYSQMLENYQSILDNQNILTDQKGIAMTEITKITNLRNSIMIAENLIKNKGFEDILILTDENNTNVVVKVEELTKENIAQIQNIITRELNVDIAKISITNKY